MTEEVLLRLWGKTSRENEDIYHPLLFHMLDVANVALALWWEAVGSIARRQIAADLGLSEEDAGVAVAVLAGLHDLGKACPDFQRKSKPLATHLDVIGLKVGDVSGDVPHGRVSTREITPLLRDNVCGWKADGAETLARITGAHHGSFPRSEDLDRIGSYTLGGSNWSQARSELARALANLLTEGRLQAQPIRSTPITDPGVLAVLTGLISVADWIGSSEHFPPGSSTAPQEYAVLSQRRTREALVRFGWLPAMRPASAADFGAIFPFHPNSLQSAVAQLAAERQGPYLLLVEAPMGTGKTEAALFAADQSLCAGSTRGFYIALPTQATSNAMYGRVRKYLDRRRHSGLLNLQLVHSNAFLADTPQLSPIYAQSTDDNGRAAAQSWFTARKRSLLAPLGVGTIDQSLLSVLQTRHWFVRLFGLAYKTVIFDEVHAYDTYTSTLLKRLLHWLAQLHCNIILLSATLPEAQRQELVGAYTGSTPAELPRARYPRITVVDAARPVPVPVRVEVEKDWEGEIALYFADTRLETLAQQLCEELAAGGCAAVICNTISRAQKVYNELKSVFKDEEFLLFHSRYPFAWRRERERQVLRMFGKEGQRPARAVLVATQVVEQSLDLDFDWMATDMAPTDLLLQRAGRLHRHDRSAEERHGLRRHLTILCDGTSDGPPPLFPNRKPYERYVLLRSWLAIRDKKKIDLPSDIDALVQETYSELSDLRHADAAWQQALRQSYAEMEAKRVNDEREAEKVLLCAPEAPEELVEKFNALLYDDEDPRVHPSLQAATRQGRSISIVCLRQTEQGLKLPDEEGLIIDLDRKPGVVASRLLLDSALPISEASDQGVYHALCGESPPEKWAKNPHLRFHRVVRFVNGLASVSGATLEIDRKMGLVITRKS
jgi:CRISPR-associated endonuclease/helicase Cas3